MSELKAFFPFLFLGFSHLVLILFSHINCTTHLKEQHLLWPHEKRVYVAFSLPARALCYA